MKKQTNFLYRVMSLAIMVVMLLTTFVFPTCAAKIPTPTSSAYISCYTLSSSGKVYVYTNASLNKKTGGYIACSTDECRIISISGNAVQVSYPVSGGRRTAWVPASTFTNFNLSGNLQTATASAKITTYRRAGGTSYGSVSANDKVYLLGSSGGYTQLLYPVGAKWKLAFVRTTDADRYLKTSGTTNTPSTTASSTAASIGGGSYTIVSALRSNLVLDISGNGTANHTNVQIYSANASAAQTIQVVSVGNSYYKLVHAHSGRVIDVSGGSKASGANVQLYDWNGSDAQLWRFISDGNGGYYIQNKLGTYLDVAGGTAASGTNVWAYAGNRSKAQIWYLKAANSDALHSPIADGAKFSKKSDDNGWYGYHDINSNVSTSTPVYAITNGTAYFYQYNTNGKLRSYGNYVKFVSSDGVYEVRYAHLSGFNGMSSPITADSAYPCSGAADEGYVGALKVTAGQTLGWVGTTGNSSAPHLHIEVYKKGARVDPTAVFPNLV